MKTFSLNLIGDSYSARVCETIMELKNYFIHYNGANAAEAMNRAYANAMENRKEEYTCYLGYRNTNTDKCTRIMGPAKNSKQRGWFRARGCGIPLAKS